MLGKNKCIVIMSLMPCNKILKFMVPESGIEILGLGTECRYDQDVFFYLSTDGRFKLNVRL